MNQSSDVVHLAKIQWTRNLCEFSKLASRSVEQRGAGIYEYEENAVVLKRPGRVGPDRDG